MRVLIIGPLPPPLGGATVLFNELNNYLHESNDVACDTIDTTSRGQGGFSRIYFALCLIYKIIIKIKQCDVLFFHASLRGAYQFGLIVKLICLWYKKPWGFRGFGGNYYNWYISTNFINRWLLRHGVLSADIILFETKKLINDFNSTVNSPCIWYPNSRYIYTNNLKSDTCKKLVFIGHVKPEKGVNELISIAEDLPESVIIDVYGPIQEGIRETDFIHKSVSYKGVLKPDMVLATLSNYDALVFPTYYDGEGYPGVILEAYACGIPVITSNWKMIPEIVDDTSGILIEPKNKMQLLDAIIKITSDSAYYQSLSDGVLNKAKQYDMKIWNKNFIDCCNLLKRLKGV